MGFADQLHETLNRLPPTRQTLLFSATLPKTLVEFAKAGLQNPKLIRLDADSKISADLQMAFLSVKPGEKEAALFCLLRDVIGVPHGDAVRDWEHPLADMPEAPHAHGPPTAANNFNKRKRDGPGNQEMASHQTLVFAATKHQVEFLTVLLTNAGYAVSQIYGSLDQINRKLQLAAFRAGRTNILVVTDLAARGIDIPLLENVINYDFPVGSRSFIHRVGRTARAGRKGWAYSLLVNNELAHLYDLELFLTRPITLCPLPAVPVTGPKAISYTTHLVLGCMPRDSIDPEVEHIRNVLIDPSPTLTALHGTAERGHKMYERSSAKASPESYRRAKDLIKSGKGLAGTTFEDVSMHPIFSLDSSAGPSSAAQGKEAKAKANLLATITAFRPNETIFEQGTKGGKTAAAQLMKDRRASLGKIIKKSAAAAALKAAETPVASTSAASADDEEEIAVGDADMSEAEEADLEDAFEIGRKPKAKSQAGEYKDSAFYLNYAQEGAQTEKGCVAIYIDLAICLNFHP